MIAHKINTSTNKFYISFIIIMSIDLDADDNDDEG